MAGRSGPPFFFLSAFLPVTIQSSRLLADKIAPLVATKAGIFLWLKTVRMAPGLRPTGLRRYNEK
jgi:hypothetical protein